MATFLKKFKTLAEGFGYKAKTPFVGTVEGISRRAVIIPERVGALVEVKDDEAGFLKYGDPLPLLTVTYTDGSTQVIYDLSDFSWDQDSSNIKTAEFHDGVTEIPECMFMMCNSLTSITLPDTLINIGDNAFSDCSSLTSVTLPDSVTSIGTGAFANCSFTSIKLPNSIQSIGSWAFSDCSSLTSITLPNSLLYIGQGVFGYSSITSLNIPASVKLIGSYLDWFGDIVSDICDGCSDLTSITVDKNNTVYNDGNGLNCIIETSTDKLIQGCKTTIIPNTVTSIGADAFYDIPITGISLPDSVISIDQYAFGRWNIDSVLTSITLNEGLETIEYGAFYSQSKLESIDIPSTVTSIGGWAFYYCSSLKEITFNWETPIEFKLNPFNYYNDEDIVSNGVINIPYGTTDAYLANILCSYLINNYGWTLNEAAALYTAVLQEDGTYKFYDKKTDVELSSRLGDETSIIYYNEENKKHYDQVVKYYYVTYNDTEYLSKYYYVVSSTENTNIIMTSETNKFVMYVCYNQGWAANEDYMTKDEAAAVTYISCVFNGGTNGTGVGDNPVDYFTSFDEFQYFTGLTEIPDYAFAGCFNLKSIIIPNSVTSIGYDAFNWCSGLTSITIPNSVINCNEDFADCSSLPIIDNIRYADTYLVKVIDKSLSSYTIKEGTRFIGYRAFYNCTSLTTITIPNTVTSIGYSAFSGCTELTSITIPDSVTSICEYAFYNCTSLTSVTIGNKVTSIGNQAFYNCTSLTTITIPNSVTSIGYSAFYNCTSLTTITIPNTVTSIGYSAFADCTELTSITIPDSVTSICNNTFYVCTSLTSVTIGNKVTSIGYSAFSGCTGLTSVVLKSLTPPTILSSTFNNTSTIYYVDTDVVDTYKSATNWSTFADRIQSAYMPQTYKSMTITADDVKGRKTTTTIHYSIVTDGISNVTGETMTDITITGTATSDTFELNTDTENTVTRHITFTYHGLTAECDITQGVWIDKDQTVDLNSQWVESTVTKDGYDIYLSNSNYNINSSYASMKVTFVGQPEFKLYINSYAEDTYDYTVAFTMDQAAPTSLPESSTSGVVAHTSGKQNNPTTDLSTGWTCVSYPNDGNEHFVWITYRKDSFGHSNNDRGYVAIPLI